MIQTWQQYKDEAQNYTVDWSVRASKLSTTVSSVVWSVENGSAAISNEALASNSASATVTTNSTECSLIKLKATLADGQIDVHYFKVRVNQPICVNDGARY